MPIAEGFERTVFLFLRTKKLDPELLIHFALQRNDEALNFFYISKFISKTK